MGSFPASINGGSSSKPKKSFNTFILGPIELMRFLHDTTNDLFNGFQKRKNAANLKISMPPFSMDSALLLGRFLA
jgi:hypothetical protein